MTALTRLDQNRAMAQVADKLNVSSGSLSKVVIWGNHSLTQVPDLNNAVIEGQEKKSVLKEINDMKWVYGEFITTVAKRGGAII